MSAGYIFALSFAVGLSVTGFVLLVADVISHLRGTQPPKS